MNIKLGIVGFGFMGHCDADMLSGFDGIELKAVADINPDQMKDAPSGVETYASMDEMLAHADINTVMISTPNPSHLEMVEKDLRKSKDIRDRIYVCRIIDRMRVRKIRKVVFYSEAQIYRILDSIYKEIKEL